MQCKIRKSLHPKHKYPFKKEKSLERLPFFHWLYYVITDFIFPSEWTTHRPTTPPDCPLQGSFHSARQNEGGGNWATLADPTSDNFATLADPNFGSFANGVDHIWVTLALRK